MVPAPPSSSPTPSLPSQLPLFPEAKVGLACQLGPLYIFEDDVHSICAPPNKLLGGRISASNWKLLLTSCKAGSILLSNQHFPGPTEHLAPSRETEHWSHIQYHFQILPFISGAHSNIAIN